MAVTYGSTDRCTGGTASADNEEGANVASRAFDDNNTTYWNSVTAMPHWLKYAFAAGVSWKISKVTIRPVLDYGILNFNVQGSNDDSSYTTLYSGTCANSETVQTFTFTNPTAYRYIKINVTSGSNNQCATTEVAMYEGIYPYTGNGSISSNPMIF